MAPGSGYGVVTNMKPNVSLRPHLPIATVQPAQCLKLSGPKHVNITVKEWNSRMQGKAHRSTRQFVKVAAPTVHAGVGDALRQAYRMDGEISSLKTFEDLLARLD